MAGIQDYYQRGLPTDESMAQQSAPLGGYQFDLTQSPANPISYMGSFANIPQAPTTDEYKPSAEDSEIDASSPAGMPSAKNANQNGTADSKRQMANYSDVMKAYQGIQDLIKTREGIRMPGQSDIIQKYRISGSQLTPYYTYDVSPKEHRGLSGELINDKPEDQGGKLPSKFKTWEGPHAWEKGGESAGAYAPWIKTIYGGDPSKVGQAGSSWSKPRINPYTGTAII